MFMELPLRNIGAGVPWSDQGWSHKQEHEHFKQIKGKSSTCYWRSSRNRYVGGLGVLFGSDSSFQRRRITKFGSSNVHLIQFIHEEPVLSVSEYKGSRYLGLNPGVHE